MLSRSIGQIIHALLTRPPLGCTRFGPKTSPAYNPARLACVRHAASVHPEPGSNSHVYCFFWLRFRILRIASKFFPFADLICFQGLQAMPGACELTSLWESMLASACALAPIASHLGPFFFHGYSVFKGQILLTDFIIKRYICQAFAGIYKVFLLFLIVMFASPSERGERHYNSHMIVCQVFCFKIKATNFEV